MPVSLRSKQPNEWRAVIDHQQDISNALKYMKSDLKNEVIKDEQSALQERKQ